MDYAKKIANNPNFHIEIKKDFLHYPLNALYFFDMKIFNWLHENNIYFNSCEWNKILENYILYISREEKIISNGKLCIIDKKLIFYWLDFYLGQIIACNLTNPYKNTNDYFDFINWNSLYSSIKRLNTPNSKILIKYFIDLNLIDRNYLNNSDGEYYDYLVQISNRKSYINYHYMKFINKKN